MENFRDVSKDGLLVEGFVIKITKEESDKVLEHYKDSKELSVMCEHGAAILGESKYIIEFCDNGDIYFATINMLVRGNDGLVVQLRHDVNEYIDTDQLPCFDDIFKVIEFG